MKVVVDASVFVGASHQSDAHFAQSDAFISYLRKALGQVYCPALVLPESVGALSRITGDETLAYEVEVLIRSIPGIRFVPMSLRSAADAAGLAARFRLRGADSVYVSVARMRGAGLITWDREMLDRSAAVVTTRTPAEWLKEQTEKEGR